jgi:hypothetical protein
MTQAQLDRSIAGLTGESPRTIQRLGFGLQATTTRDLEPEDLCLVVDCPSCGRPVSYPGVLGDGSVALAECADPRCDIYFDFDLSDVYAASSQSAR